jgi:hypothetical protein
MMFLLLALALAAAFLFGMQQGAGRRLARRRAAAAGDYADRLVAEIGTPPSIERRRRWRSGCRSPCASAARPCNWDSNPGE